MGACSVWRTPALRAGGSEQFGSGHPTACSPGGAGSHKPDKGTCLESSFSLVHPPAVGRIIRERNLWRRSGGGLFQKSLCPAMRESFQSCGRGLQAANGPLGPTARMVFSIRSLLFKALPNLRKSYLGRSSDPGLAAHSRPGGPSHAPEITPSSPCKKGVFEDLKKNQVSG